MSESSFQSAAVVLLRECFEGKEPGRNYTWFVQGKEGMFDAVESVDARRASVRPNNSAPSVAAHAYHVLYALRGANAMHGQPEPEGDWEGTWSKHEVSTAEWDELRTAIRTEYASFMRWFRNQTEWVEASMPTGALALLPHMAYHLGAIRQILYLTPG